MKKSAIHILRIALFALIFQISSPLFVSVITLNNEFRTGDDRTKLHAEDHTVSVPALVKDKDESETKEQHYIVALIQLIDFSDHTFELAESHKTKITPLQYFHKVDPSPPLFTLKNEFLI